MKQFNCIKKVFDDFDGVLNGENWYLIDNQEDIDGISASITGNGSVWEENGKIKYSGKAPSEYHVFNVKTKRFEISQEKLTSLLNEKRYVLIDQIDSHASEIYSQWTRFETEYRERKAVAEAYKSAGYQGECSRYITDFAKHAGIDNKSATDLILVQAAGLEKLQVELANQRMRKYELKAPNLTLEQMQATYDDIIKNMDNLMEAYKKWLIGSTWHFIKTNAVGAKSQSKPWRMR